MNISYHLMGSPKYWLAMPIVAPAMHITTETWNYLRHPRAEFNFPLRVSFFVSNAIKSVVYSGHRRPWGHCVFIQKNFVFQVWHIWQLSDRCWCWSSFALICHFEIGDRNSFVLVFSCPGSSIPDPGQWVGDSLKNCQFRIWTQRVTFDTSDPSDIWLEWNYKDKDQKESLILRRQGSFALLRCFNVLYSLHLQIQFSDQMQVWHKVW